MIEVDYTDAKGIPRRALVNDEYDNPNTGILTSLYLDEALRELGWADYQIKRLYEELTKRGIITPAQVTSESHALLRSALMAVLAFDVQTLQTIAEAQNGRTNSSPKRVSGR